MAQSDPSIATLTPPMRRTIGLYALATGQTICWVGLYYSFAALLLSWERDLGWAKTDLTLGLTIAVLIAAVMAPLAGRMTDADGGRWMLTLGALAGAGALGLLATVTTRYEFLVVWALIGIAQGLCLYESCFAFMTRVLGADAPGAILRLTLVAGFASPISFTVGATAAEVYGWQVAVLGYAVAIAVLGAPLHFIGATLLRSVTPTSTDTTSVVSAEPANVKKAVRIALGKPTFWLMALAFPLIALNHGILLNHIIPLLVERGTTQATAITAASIIGPMQVVGRLLVFRFEGRATMLTITFISIGGLIAASALLLVAGVDTILVFAFAATQGAAYGLVSILRPTVIADTLGRDGFGSIAGWLAVPYLTGYAVAPYVGALLWAVGGYDLAVLMALVFGGVGFLAFLLLRALQAREAVNV